MSFLSAPSEVAGVPLASLPAVVLDTETTGLDITRDRVIEIGAVRLATVDGPMTETFARLVSPGMPIPESASNVHGIFDSDLADAPDFAAVMADFAAWTGPSVVIGFSMGFDLAVLKAEHARNALVWQAPRSLDVRHLVEFLAPELPESSLEMTAKWLEIEVTGRHRALDDAVLTAQTFAALVPKLRERGITTLAQAERAAQAQTARLDGEARAGWHAVGPPDEAISEFARVDSFPYRHHVSEMMRTPPVLLDGATALGEALTTMVAEKVSSVFLAPGPGALDHGILTERDVLRAIEAHGESALRMPVANIGSRPLASVNADEFAYRALTAMASGGFRHLGVRGPDGMLIGALSARDLLRQRAEDAVSLGESIEAAATPAQLGLVWSELVAVTRALVREEVDARNIAAIISRELRALTARACELAEAELARAGNGPAPANYAMLVLGSGGRGESLLAMDQDNAIVFAAGGADPETQKWFAALGKRVSEILDEIGVAYCKGGVMAANAPWRADMSGWRTTISSWITRSRPEDILNCDIFFDAAPAFGDASLADGLMAEARATAKSARNFLRLMSANVADLRSPRGFFGQIKQKNGRIDLKACGIMPIFSAARVAALRLGISARSTPARLQGARSLGRTAPETIENLIEAHRILLGIILGQQLADIDSGLPLSNAVALAKLSSLERKKLNWALDQVTSVRDLLDMPLIG